MKQREKVKQWIKENKKVIISIGAISAIAGGSVWLIKTNQIHKLKNTVSSLDVINAKQTNRIHELENLCLDKDKYVNKLASELLRQGNSIGGQLMADRKAFLQAVA